MSDADKQAFAKWSELKASNPHAAALFLNSNGDAIARGRASSTPAPTSDEDQAIRTDARDATNEAVGGALAERMVSDIRHFRQYSELRKENPHAAALYINRHGSAVYRGRDLDTEDDPGPQAA